MNRIAVLGAGAWGTAIALSLHRRGDQQITLVVAQRRRGAADCRRRARMCSSFPGFRCLRT